MRQQLTRFSIAAAFLAVLVNASLAQDEISHTELPNLQKVNERLYRGGQPKGGGFKRLAEMGVGVVVNLRDSERHARADEEKARAAGLQFFNVRMAGHARPTDEQVERVLSIINAPDSPPVFIYCRRGKDRTGTITAVYRISQEGWTGDAAISEAVNRGMFLSQFEMRDYIADYHCRRSSSGESCEDRPLIERAGTPAATAIRRAVEHSITQKTFRQFKRMLR